MPGVDGLQRLTSVFYGDIPSVLCQAAKQEISNDGSSGGLTGHSLRPV